MSEFYPTTTVTLYTKHEAFDDYDYDNESESATASGPSGVPAYIRVIEGQGRQFVDSELRGTSVEEYICRIRGHIPVSFRHSILDERTGHRYMIDELDKPSNPLGDESWVIKLRRIDND